MTVRGLSKAVAISQASALMGWSGERAESITDHR
jgi:hypothetical protein